MKTPKSRTETITGEWPRNAREVWRVALQEHQGETFLSLRAWYRNELGQLCPGKDGLNTSVVHLAPLLDALVEVYRIACATGLIQPDEARDGL